MSSGLNSTCSDYKSCNNCVSANLDCSWCSTDSSCLDSSSKSSDCPSDILNSCDNSYYTLIFIIVLSTTICLCCVTCYVRRVRRSDSDLLFEQLLSPLLPNRAREYLFRNSLVDQGEKEWMCIICGFDNKPRSKACIMCGTSKDFSSNYKEQRATRRRRLKQRVIPDDDDDEESNLVAERDSLLHQTRRDDIILSIKDDATNSVIQDPDLSSRSLSLRYFNSNTDRFVRAGAPLTPEKRMEAMNYRRINQLSLRQKSARRRKMWQRVYHPETKSMVWVRSNPKQVKVKDVGKGSTAPFGFTPRSSMSKFDADRSLSFTSRYLDVDSMSRDHSTTQNPVHDLISAATGRETIFHSPASKRHLSKDSFGDSVFYSSSPGFTSVFDEEGGLIWKRVESTIAPVKSPIRGTLATEGKSREEGGGVTDAPEFDLANVAAYTFKDKLSWFLDRMSELQKPWTEGFVRIEIRRNRVLEDSFRAWTQLERDDLHKWMRYQFRGEAGVDAGGLEREWFELLCAEIFNPSNGFFIGSGGYSGYHINPLSTAKSSNHLSYFRFFGRVFGKAIMQQQALNANLSLPLRKQIVGMPVTFSDLEFVDEELYKNLRWLQTSDEDVSLLSLDFSVTYTAAGSQEQLNFELVPGGAEIPVTNDNKFEYLQLRFRHRLLDSIKPQLENLLIGIFEVVPSDFLSVFDYQEFDLLLCGVPQIDLEDWRRHTEYLGDYNKLGDRHQVIRWFWLVLEEMSQEERSRLLQFVTGSSRLPVQGFKALQSTDGKYRRFNIQSITKSSSVYPRAHTCFNKLDLPVYDSRNELEAYLSYVINLDSIGFNME